MIREHIVKHPDEWDEIIHEQSFESLFSVKGSSLKNIPKGYLLNHASAEYLKNKSWYIEYGISDKMLLDAAGFLEEAAKIYAAMKPFNDYLNAALYGFKMPRR